MTTLYYLPPDCITGNWARLPEGEAHHAVHVVRHKEGDVIEAVDGEGGWYRIQLSNVDRRLAEGEILKRKQNVGEPSYRLTIALGLLKNQKRFEVFIEKGTELGVSRVVPLITKRTEKRSYKRSRVDSILVAAMKQCGRSRMMEVDDVQSLDEVISKGLPPLTLCCHEKAPTNASLKHVLASSRSTKDLLVLVGPEGGFSESEIEKIKSHAVKLISLGQRRLRAETAAIAASAGVLLAWS